MLNKPDLTESEQALALMLPRITAVTQAELRVIGVDVRRGAMRAIGALETIRRYLDLLAPVGITAASLDELRLLALATYEAETRLAAHRRRPRPLRLLYGEVSTVRRELVAVVKMFVALGRMDGTVLEGLRGPHGHEEVSSDVGTLVTALRDAAPALGSRLPLTAAELTRARALATELAHASAAQRDGLRPRADAALLRNQAYSLLVRTYGEVRSAVRLVRQVEKDADRIAPALFTNRGPSRRASEKKIAEARNRSGEGPTNRS